MEEDTPGAGDTRLTSLDDVVTFHDDMTFQPTTLTFPIVLERVK